MAYLKHLLLMLFVLLACVSSIAYTVVTVDPFQGTWTPCDAKCYKVYLEEASSNPNDFGTVSSTYKNCMEVTCGNAPYTYTTELPMGK